MFNSENNFIVEGKVLGCQIRAVVRVQALDAAAVQRLGGEDQNLVLDAANIGGMVQLAIAKALGTLQECQEAGAHPYRFIEPPPPPTGPAKVLYFPSTPAKEQLN